MGWGWDILIHHLIEEVSTFNNFSSIQIVYFSVQTIFPFDKNQNEDPFSHTIYLCIEGALW